jgi:2'-5' RNA ligase
VTKKVFLLTLEFELEEKPKWLDGFRIKYDEPLNYHITLKFLTLIKESDLPKIRSKVKSIAKANKPLTLEFDKYFFDRIKDRNYIMVSAKHNNDLYRLQKMVVSELRVFGETIKSHYNDFENNFTPHITIGRRLLNDVFQIAKNELEEEIYCKANITKLALTVVDENSTVDDVINPKNTTYYDLGDCPDRSS